MELMIDLESNGGVIIDMIYQVFLPLKTTIIIMSLPLITRLPSNNLYGLGANLASTKFALGIVSHNCTLMLGLVLHQMCQVKGWYLLHTHYLK